VLVAAILAALALLRRQTANARYLGLLRRAHSSAALGIATGFRAYVPARLGRRLPVRHL
jgi:hypothetical protein